MTSPIDLAIRASVCLLLCGPAYADGVITMRGREVIATPGRDDHANATAALLRALSGLAFGRITSTLGVERARGPAGGMTLDLVSADYPIGSFYAGRIEALDVDRARLRFTLVNVDGLYACRDRNDTLRIPILGQMKYVCIPGSRVGIGGTVGELAWDPRARRLAARWAELRVVVNLAGATSSMAYLRGHVDASIGVDAESVWHGDRDARNGADHFARGVLALTTMLRSPDAHWEVRAKVEARPALVGTVSSLRDHGVVADGMLLYHVITGANTAVSTGFDLRIDHWSDPSTSLAPLDASTNPTSIFVGALVEVRRGITR